MSQMTLFQFNQFIKDALKENIPPQLWIVAEIGELRINQKGHCYMELVEKEGNFIQAKLKANIWAYHYRNISSNFLNATGSALVPGIKVLINASINFHEVYGLSVTVNDIDPNYTLGERSKQKELTIEKLKSIGAFELNKQLPLPLVPQKIAVISSETAAGYQDFKEQLKHNSRNLDVRITLFNALMQGNGAPESIMSAAQQVIERGDFDLLVIIRGGGAQIDLDCFDSYELNEFLCKMNLPVLSGIGHERDQTIVDLIAHTSLKTPTAVAEFILEGLYRVDDNLYDALTRIKRGSEIILSEQKHYLDQLSQHIVSQTNFRVSSANQKINRLSQLLSASALHRLKLAQMKLKNLEHILLLNNPQTILSKGYTITLKKGKSIQKQTLNSGDEITTLTSTRSIKSTVTQSEHD